MGNGDLQISNEILDDIKCFVKLLTYNCQRSFKANRPIVDVHFDGKGLLHMCVLYHLYHGIITGLQHYVISAPEPWGLPLNHTTMGQHFKRLGYATHIVGKVRLNAAQLLSFYMALRVCRGVINFN